VEMSGCNLYGNIGDLSYNISYLLEINGNFSADPCFCDWVSGDFSLCEDSWCLPAQNPWGWGVTVGAFDIGCGVCDCPGPVSSVSKTWSSVKAMYR
jgi:hypothetical protein